MLGHMVYKQQHSGLPDHAAQWLSLPLRPPGRPLPQLQGVEVLVEVPVLHVLGDHAQGVRVHAHGQQAHDVGVPQARQDADLLQEVVPGTQSLNDA